MHVHMFVHTYVLVQYKLGQRDSLLPNTSLCPNGLYQMLNEVALQHPTIYNTRSSTAYGKVNIVYTYICTYKQTTPSIYNILQYTIYIHTYVSACVHTV